MKTKDIIGKTGIDRETLRFYESKGLLDKPQRTDSGYRIYTEDDVTRLSFIKRAKAVGFTLREITELVKFREDKPTCRQGRDIAQNKVQQLEQKIKELKNMRSDLKRFIKACECEGEAGLDKKCTFTFDSYCCEKGCHN